MHSKRKGIFIVFILGHLEVYKGANELMYQRLKILGKQATKLGIECLGITIGQQYGCCYMDQTFGKDKNISIPDIRNNEAIGKAFINILKATIKKSP